MKTLKKIISLSLAMTMIITTLLTNCAFAAIQFNDVNESTAYSEAIYNLVADGVLNGYDNEDGSKSFKPEANITRAEFAKVIVVAKYGANVLANATTSNFTDMEGNWAIPYVTYANGAGIINGYEDGTFRPANPVTYAEAVKMIVCALGYAPVVEATTPWYQGYINIANTIGLTKGAMGMAEVPAVRGLVAQLIDNMGDCKTLVQDGVNADGTPSYSVSSGNDITGQETYEDTGVLIGVYDNSLKGTDTQLNMGRINIDENIFELESSINYLDLVDYLGQAVTYKWYTKSGARYITAIKSANTTDIYTVNAEQIDSFDGSKLHYYEDVDDYDTESYSIASDVYIVYNGYGVEKSEITTENLTTWFDIDSGSLTFYNNDGDRDMDVVYVEKFDTYYVSAPVTSKGVTTIKDKISSSRTVSLDEDDVIVTKVSTAGGSEVEAKLTSIANNNIVSVAAPLNPNGKTTVKISAATASGAISEMGDDYEDVKIGTKEYKFTQYFRDLVESEPEKYGFDMGANVKFYLDFEGRVVFADVTVATDPYGYLIDYVEDAGMESEGVTVRLVDSNNKLITYELKSKVKINGTSYDEDDVIAQLEKSAARIEANKTAKYSASAPSDETKVIISQIVKFSTSSENGKTVIDELYTVAAEAPETANGENGGIVPVWTTTDDAEKAPFINCDTKLECSGTGTTKQFKANGATQFAVGSNTIVFKIPYGRSDVDEFRKTKGSGGFSNGSTYYVEAYDIEGTTAEVVVYYAASSTTGASVYANTQSYLVVSKKQANNDDGKTVHELEYVKIGDRIADEADETKLLTKTVYAADLEQLADYVEGDIIRFATSDGEIDDVEKLFIYSEKTVYGKETVDGEEVFEPATNNYYSQKYSSKEDYFQAHYGKVFTVNVDDAGEGEITIYNGDSQEDYNLYTITADTKYYTLSDRGDVEDSGSGAITDAYTSDYETASNVLVISYNDEVKGVYIISEQ